jgi:hypothetical protein
MDNKYDREKYALLDILFEYFDVRKNGESAILLGALGESNTFIAGGAITSVFMEARVSDLDFYLHDTSLTGAVEELFKSFGFERSFKTETALTFTRTGDSRSFRVQLIRAFYGSPEDVFSTYDFSVCCGCYSFREERFILHENFLPDICARRLSYMGGSRFPIAALYRTLKYARKGFRVTSSLYIHILLCVQNLEITTYRELKRQLLGIDTLFLGDYLRNKDPEAHYDIADFIDDALELIEVADDDLAEIILADEYDELSPST